VRQYSGKAKFIGQMKICQGKIAKIIL